MPRKTYRLRGVGYKRKQPIHNTKNKRVKRSDALFGYGNWCGPGWSAGKPIDAKDLTAADYNVPAVDALDEACKQHDIDISEADTDEETIEADKKFQFYASQFGITGKLFGYLVKKYGPSSNLSGFKRAFDEYQANEKGSSISRDQLRQSKRINKGESWKAVRRDIMTVWDPNVTSLSNLTPSADMGDAKTGNHETPVDDPHTVYRGPPDFTFCALPWLGDGMIRGRRNFAMDRSYRLTSPYDPSMTVETSDQNAGSGDMMVTDVATTDTTIDPARWFNMYAGMYKYYHTISCQWKVTVENYGSEPIWIYVMHCSDSTPPLLATNQDIQLWRGVEYKYLPPKAWGLAVGSGGDDQNEVITNFLATASQTVNEKTNNLETSTRPSQAGSFASGNNVASNMTTICDFAGTYEPGDFHREIRQDSDVENWTLTNTNPTLLERLLVRIKPQSDAVNLNNTDNYGDRFLIRFRVHLNYLVEFKELKEGLQWPVQRQPVSITINNDVQTSS